MGWAGFFFKGWALVITEKQVWAALPSSGFLRSYVEWASKWSGATAAFHTVAGLCLLAQSAPSTLSFPWQTRLNANFYGLMIGPSAAGKGRAVSSAKAILTPAIPRAEFEQPGSPEGCLEALQPYPQLLFYDEFGQFLQSSYGNGYMSPLRTTYTNLYDCARAGRRLVSRPGRKAQPIEPNPRLSMLAGGTPAFLEGFTTHTDWEGGFMSRFFFMHATSERTEPDAYSVTGEQERLFLEQRLATYQRRSEESPLIPLLPGPQILEIPGWSPEALPRWHDWKEKIDKARRSVAPVAAGGISRAAAYTVKIALLLSWDIGETRSGLSWLVQLDALEHAIALVKLHVQSLSELVDGLALSRDKRDERSTYQAIEKHTPQHLVLRNSGLVAKRAKEMIGSLMDKDLIQIEVGPDGKVYYNRIEEPTNVIPLVRPAPQPVVEAMPRPASSEDD